jgi:prepilin-type N-terminal cleavage/methylation domain-containing protein
MTLVEILIVVAIIGVLTSIAVPALMSARRHATEAATAASMHAIADAQHVFAASCAGGSFATKLSQLGRPPSGGGEAFLSADLSATDSVEKSGYIYTLDGGSDGVPAPRDACNGVRAEELSTSFYATATPDSSVPGAGTMHYWIGVQGTLFASSQAISSTLGDSDPPGAQALGGSSRGRGSPRGAEEAPRPRNP